jgi:hypothetical protein
MIFVPNTLFTADVSLILRSGASAKVAQELARHSAVQLTLAWYVHAGLYNLTAAVNALASLTSGPQPEALTATGTDGASKSLARSLAHERRIDGTMRDGIPPPPATKKPRKTSGNRSVSGVRGKLPELDSNQQPSD